MGTAGIRFGDCHVYLISTSYCFGKGDSKDLPLSKKYLNAEELALKSNIVNAHDTGD